MPLGSKTWLYAKSVVKLERDEYGVYELLDSTGGILYIGHGKIIASLLQHFEDGTYPVTGVHSFSIEYTWNKRRSETRYKEELERYHMEHDMYPRFNQAFR